MIESAFIFVFQALIYENTGKNLEIELFDEDTDKDDFLGWYNFYQIQIFEHDEAPA